MSQDHFMLRRRDLLALAPACAVTAGLTSSPAAAACLFGHQPERLALAYWPGSAVVPDFERVAELPHQIDEEDWETIERGALVSADQVESGEARFAQSGARLRVHGLFGADGPAAKALAPLSIEAHFTPFHDIPAQLWSYDSGCACPGNAMTLPVTADSGLNLSFQIDGAAAAIRFSLGGEGGQPKLRRGIYLASWRGALGDSLPAWQRFQLLSKGVDPADESDHGTHQLRLAQGDATPDQPYLVLSIDYAA